MMYDYKPEHYRLFFASLDANIEILQGVLFEFHNFVRQKEKIGFQLSYCIKYLQRNPNIQCK